MFSADGVESAAARRARELVAGCGEVGGVLLGQFEEGVWSFEELLLLVQVLVGEEWRGRAACRGMDVELFFPERGVSPEGAKAVCRGCVVREECGDFAWNSGEAYGIWGGFGARSRRGGVLRAVGCVVCGVLVERKSRKEVPLCSEGCRERHGRRRREVYKSRQRGVA